jgi:hypothetical protein
MAVRMPRASVTLRRAVCVEDTIMGWSLEVWGFGCLEWGCVEALGGGDSEKDVYSGVGMVFGREMRIGMRVSGILIKLVKPVRT